MRLCVYSPHPPTPPPTPSLSPTLLTFIFSQVKRKLLDLIKRYRWQDAGKVRFKTRIKGPEGHEMEVRNHSLARCCRG
jgi:hypothetical protein